MRTWQNGLISGALVAVGVIHVLPGMMSLFLGGPLYEVAVAGPDLEVLLRHRAVLLTLVGAALIASAFLSRLRAAAMIGAVVSMGTFALLVFGTPGVNDELVRVAWVDVVALAVLGTVATRTRVSAEAARR
jgi:hypothetical protein